MGTITSFSVWQQAVGSTQCNFSIRTSEGGAAYTVTAMASTKASGTTSSVGIALGNFTLPIGPTYTVYLSVTFGDGTTASASASVKMEAQKEISNFSVWQQADGSKQCNFLLDASDQVDYTITVGGVTKVAGRTSSAGTATGSFTLALGVTYTVNVTVTFDDSTTLSDSDTVEMKYGTGAHIWDGSEWKAAVPYVWTGLQWEEAEPDIRT